MFTMLQKLKIPLKFCYGSILTATYLINHFPSPHFAWQDSYELLFSSRRDYDRFRVFGCFCYASSSSIDEQI